MFNTGGKGRKERPKVDFNAIPAPKGYVAGIGRGAAGFTTRSDIGPGSYKPGEGEGGEGGDDKKEGDNPERQQFDEFMGADGGMFASGAYEEDDREADQVWDAIDDYMDGRRREQREARLKEEVEKHRRDNPKITEQFADLKRKLADVSYAEWEAIPEIGDYSIKNKKRFESFTPVPDTLLAKAAAEKSSSSSINPDGATTQDLTAVGEGRGTMLSLKLDNMADSVSGQTVVDPKGYMTELKSVKISSEAEVSDIKKARTLLKSVITTNPKHAPGWISAARIEELAGRIQAARQLIMQGLENCPTDEDVWLEAARLQTPENAKAVLARAVSQLPESVNIWLQAAKLEQDTQARSRVLRKALERVPNSVRLWKAAVDLASEDDARVLLARAVECCPQHVDLWLALARLETYENARKVLNKAREAVPTDAQIWFTAAMLEESHGNEAIVEKIIERAIKSLRANGVVIDREAWMKEAETCERLTPPMVATCRAVVKAVVGLGVEDEDRKRTWMADAEECIKRGSVETARAIYQHALSVFSAKKGVWRRAALLEKQQGNRAALDQLLRKAVTYCPQATVLWLMAAKEKWLGGDVPAARQILAEAFAANPDSEDVWLAAFKLEFENQEFQRARLLLQRARETSSASTPRVWMKSALVERELGDTAAEKALLQEGIKRYPAFWKLWLMLGQLEERTGNLDGARQAFVGGVKAASSAVPLWVSYAALEERCGNLGKARAVLDQARLRNTKNADLWLAAVRLEIRAQNAKAAEAQLAKALQECPSSGILWSQCIAMAPRPQRKSKCTDALKNCDNDPFVICAVAQLFWHDRKVDKARSWLTRAVALNRDIGDFWAFLYSFEVQHGTPEQQAEVVQRCREAEPRHGELWCAVAKNPANSKMGVDEVLKKVSVEATKIALG